jgi:histidinol-phosphate phosphatase family protein
VSGAPDPPPPEAPPHAPGGRRAVFLDRDGTLIRDAHYIARAEQVALLAGAARAVRRLNAAGVAVVVVTNQSGIARGLVTPDGYMKVKARLDELLAAEGARIDATYFCPHHPDITGPCDCRKPGVALYQRAVQDLGIDAARSAFVGDRFRDVAPARRFGGTGILVPSPETPYAEMERAREEAAIATTLDAAVDRILR